MLRIIGLLCVVLMAFYGVWPAYSGYRIKSALQTENAELLASKIDFDAVRVSLKPAVTAEVEKAMTGALQQGGGQNEALLKQLKTQMMPAVVDGALATIVTPESMLRIYRERDIKKTVAAIVAEKLGGGGAAGLGGLLGGGDTVSQLGKVAEAAGIDPGKVLGGLFGKKAAPPVAVPSSVAAPATPTTTAPASSFGMANVKSFGVTGPLGFSVGVSKDAATATPDVVADMAFTGGDWKIVGVRPRI
jgi:hypothetical protein